MKHSLTRVAALLLAALMTLTALTACGQSQQPQSPAEDPVTIRLGGLKGPTSIGMVKLLNDSETGAAQNEYTFQPAGAADELTPLLLKGELDVVAVPANLAAVLYNKSEGAVQFLAVNTLGVLYIVEKGGDAVTDWESLRGQTIYATGKGTTPEYLSAGPARPDTGHGCHRRVENRAQRGRGSDGLRQPRHCHAAPALCHRCPDKA